VRAREAALLPFFACEGGGESGSNADRVRGRAAGGQRELRLRPPGRVVAVVVDDGAGQRQQGGGAAVRREGGERRGGAELLQGPVRNHGGAAGRAAQQQVGQSNPRLCQSFFLWLSEAVCDSVFKCSVKKSGDFSCDRPGKVVWHSVWMFWWLQCA